MSTKVVGASAFDIDDVKMDPLLEAFKAQVAKMAAGVVREYLADPEVREDIMAQLRVATREQISKQRLVWVRVVVGYSQGEAP